ncbi:MAG: Exodeoxyribonuclease 7 large subunit [Candidatus Uhrbacteria bacterium GW2011_GWD2_52_7]|uniref:Exodeoxyribonuclease 7 large subunit n=1 Tax=Candidatus Uhrbacteria bacterium GW2011_GWD2_52_7 TaxID=1618989 RepID=A0A0G1XHK6_9BACT|nr:MAG: Exodeoxyribonuclease 7 large subunit [Candidatus Uhrbacteria bacterium GW2011_GWD2_52_7]
MAISAIISVSDFLSLINHALRSIPTDGMAIEGEVVDFKVSQGKWVTFDLKDEKVDAKIGCFMTTFQLMVPLAAGMKVHVKGYPKVAEKWGKLSFNVQSVELVGEGAYAKAYAALKEKLRLEGLFDAGRKRQIPRIPERIGLITSSEAAAYGDFLRILQNRFGGVTVLHVPVHVQGQFAVAEILGAFAQFNAMPPDERPDVLVLTRGGGALEDLHAFNDEQVARAVFSSAIPVVVGVGHERDESLCDFVADVRASTPSNAAELVAPDRRDIDRSIMYAYERMAGRLQYEIGRRQAGIDRSIAVLDRSISRISQDIAVLLGRFSHSFERFRLMLIQTIDHVARRQSMIEEATMRLITQARRRAAEIERLLMSLDPMRILSRGYAIVRSGGQIVKKALEVTPGTPLSIQLADGAVEAQVMTRAQQEKLL